MVEISTMTQAEVASILKLQSQAYETLCWLDNIALLRPQMLTDRTADVLRSAPSCRAWVAKHYHEMPERLRPAPDEVEPFARLFSSLFQTSFRIERKLHDAKPYYRIVANKDAASGKAKLGKRVVPRNLRKKRRGEAERLKLRALATLAITGQSATEVAAEAVLDDVRHSRDVLAWTYVVELVERACSESSGPSVHEIWKQMDRKARAVLTADRIWHVRQRLIDALDAAMTQRMHPVTASGADGSW